MVCLLGPSGCGKTTTLRIIAGLETPSAGEVLFNDKPVTNLTPEHRNVAMVFQFYALYPALTVGENLAFPLLAEKLSAKDRDKRVSDVAEILQLTHILKRYPAEVAEGEKQRIAVARAIIRDPSCFLFDEPLSRLDVELRETMRAQIKEVLQGLSKPTVIVTHDQLEALTMADRITIMRDGAIEQIGSPHNVFAKPENAFVASFIGTPQMNLLDAQFASFDKGQAKVELDGGPLHLGVDKAVSGQPVGPIQIGVRPRAFSLASDPSSSTITVEAEIIESMGAETLVHARTPKQTEIRVVVPRETRVQSGEILHLTPDPGQTHVFDADGMAVRT